MQRIWGMYEIFGLSVEGKRVLYKILDVDVQQGGQNNKHLA